MTSINSRFEGTPGMIKTLTEEEIEAVSGGVQGYRLEDGSAFSWTGPNGIVYDNVTFVGSHYFTLDGNNEYFTDYFATSTIPLPDLQGFVNAIAGAGSPPVYVSH